MAERTCRKAADLSQMSQVETPWHLACLACTTALRLALVAIVLVLLGPTGCDTTSLNSEEPQDILQHVPVGTLGVFGTFRDGELRVRSVRWRIGLLHSTEVGSPVAIPPGPDKDEGELVRARLVDASGAVLVERTAAPSPAPLREGPQGDIPEAGSFGLFLDVEDPSRVAALEVEAGEEVYYERAGSALSVSLSPVPPALVEPLNVGVTIEGRPREVLAEVHGARTSGRTLLLLDDSLRVDPTRYGRGRVYFFVLAFDDLSADLVYASSDIEVSFAEHLEIHFDGVVDTLRLPPGQRYLYLEPRVVRFTSPSESRMESPFPGAVHARSDVDGPLLERDLSPGHPELYLDLMGLTPGPRVVTVTVTMDGIWAERPLVVELQR